MTTTRQTDAVIYTVDSFTNPGAPPYAVTKAEDPRFSHCSCPDFRFRGRRGAALPPWYECKHLQEVEAEFAERGERSVAARLTRLEAETSDLYHRLHQRDKALARALTDGE